MFGFPFGSSRTRTAAARRPVVRPVFEALESRLTPTVTITPPPSGGGVLALSSNGDGDTVLVRHTVVDGLTQLFRVEVIVNGVNKGHFDDVTRINFAGNGGADHMTNRTGIVMSANGGSGKDTLIGGTGNDTLNGGSSGDVLQGKEGNDSLLGGTGGDELRGDSGKDTLKGEDGNDTLFGGKGDDVLRGGIGNDNLKGEDGVDKLFGDAGNDTLTGGSSLDPVTLIFPDQLTGGGDADSFKVGLVVFGSEADPSVDVLDFSLAQGDRFI
jgi:Ca2+-binding RTX toxin-like protein